MPALHSRGQFVVSDVSGGLSNTSAERPVFEKGFESGHVCEDIRVRPGLK